MSQRDVDALIHALIDQERDPQDGDAEMILNHIANSSFYMGRRNIPRPLQNLMREHGYAVPDRGNDLIYHWAKHVLGDQQWVSSVSAEQYFQFAIDAVRYPDGKLFVQIGQSRQHVAIVASPVSRVVPEAYRGTQSGSHLLVVYSADVGRIVAVYMAASVSQNASRVGTVWLRR